MLLVRVELWWREARQSLVDAHPLLQVLAAEVPPQRSQDPSHILLRDEEVGGFQFICAIFSDNFSEAGFDPDPVLLGDG